MARGVGGSFPTGSCPSGAGPASHRVWRSRPRLPPLAAVPGPAQETPRASAQRPQGPAASAPGSPSRVTRHLLTESEAPGQPTGAPQADGASRKGNWAGEQVLSRTPSNPGAQLPAGSPLERDKGGRAGSTSARCTMEASLRGHVAGRTGNLPSPSASSSSSLFAFAPQGLPECGSETPSPAGMEGGQGHRTGGLQGLQGGCGPSAVRGSASDPLGKTSVLPASVL